MCREEVINNINSNYKKHIKTHWKFLIGQLSLHCSAKNRIETLTDDSGNSYSSHKGKVKILKTLHRNLGSELDVKSFDES